MRWKSPAVTHHPSYATTRRFMPLRRGTENHKGLTTCRLFLSSSKNALIPTPSGAVQCLKPALARAGAPTLVFASTILACQPIRLAKSDRRRQIARVT
jgi:hypothetical protein